MLVKNVYGCLFNSETGESVGDERDMGLFYPVSMGLGFWGRSHLLLLRIFSAHIFCASCARAMTFCSRFCFHIK